MRADVTATLAPWLPQPLVQAAADLQDVDLSRLWPGAPATMLSGALRAGPEARAASGGTLWQLALDLQNAKPAPWDKGGLPVEQATARATFDGSHWTLPSASIQVAQGRVEAEGGWSPAPAPWRIKAKISDLHPGDVHTRLAGAPIDGSVTAQQRGDTLDFDLALRSRGKAGSAALRGLRLQQLQAQGAWRAQVLTLRRLQLDAEGARVEGKLNLRLAERAGGGDLQLTLPGVSAQVQGEIAPAQGAGAIKARLTDAATLQRWVEALPGLADVFQGASAKGSAQLDVAWKGGWQALQRRLENPDGVLAANAEPSVEGRLTVPRLELRPPPASPARPPVELRALEVELSGSVPQATLRAKGQVGSGTQMLTPRYRAGWRTDRKPASGAPACSACACRFRTVRVPDRGRWRRRHRSTPGCRPVRRGWT